MAGEKTTTAESLLGLLSMGPMSGYQIKQVIDQSIANFWNESFGQIYPTLKRLEKDGLVTARTDPGSGDGGRPSRIYQLTPAGRARLQEWLGVAFRPQVMRNELLLKLFFSDQAESAQARSQVLAAKAFYTENLTRYKAIYTAIQEEHPRHPGLPFWLITIRYGIAESEAHIRWADETLLELDRIAKERLRKSNDALS